MASRIRCGSCKDYFDRTDERLVQYGLGRYCTSECLSAHLDRQRDRSRQRQFKKSIAKSPRARPRPSTLDMGIKTKVRERDGNHCRFCGSSQRLQVHHVHYRSEGGPDHPSNLITLCQTHHELVHSNKRLWKPVLLGAIWLTYQNKQWTVPEVAKQLRKAGLLSE